MFIFSVAETKFLCYNKANKQNLEDTPLQNMDLTDIVFAVLGVAVIISMVIFMLEREK